MSSTGIWQGVAHTHLIWLLWLMDCVRAQYGLTYGEPRLECLPDGIRLHIDPVGIFVGHVYVRGHFNQQKCHLNYCTQSIRQPFYMEVLYRSGCNIRRHRSSNPKTVTYEVIVVIQHHPLFITAGDRAYRLNCIYRQADALLTQKINVNDPSPQAIEGRSVPQCRYDVLSSVNGPTLRFANVGEPVIHKWTCNSELHGFVVHSCVVRNPSGEEYKLIDDRGCVIEKQLVPDVKYDKDLSSAYTTISAFRFAEQIVVHFSCQITLCRKHEQGCEGIAPPTCVPIEFPPIRAFYRHTRPFDPTEATTQPGPPSTSEHYGLGSGELVTKTDRPTTTTTLSNKVESFANFYDPVDSGLIPLPKRGEDGHDANVVSSGESPEFGIEIVKTPPASPYRMFPEVPNDYRTETLSSVYDVPLGHDVDPMPRPTPAQIYYASKRKPRSHKLPNVENITVEVEAKKLMVFSDESDRLDVAPLSSDNEEPADKRCSRIIISQTIFLSAAALLQATSIAVILIQRRLYKRNLEELLLRIPSRPF